MKSLFVYLGTSHHCSCVLFGVVWCSLVAGPVLCCALGDDSLWLCGYGSRALFVIQLVGPK